MPGHQRFTPSSIERLLNQKSDFKESIPKHANDFLYCDPPYLIDQELYGQRGTDFDYKGLAKLLATRDGWVLSYNDCKKIRDMYAEYHIMQPKWTYEL